MIKHQNSTFIDPENCGSSVGYYITTGEYTTSKDKPPKYNMYATVVLADCAHKIDWGFGHNEDGADLDKIDAVISMLQEFRKKYIETEKVISRLNK